MIQQLREWNSFESKHAETAEQLLLANPQSECLDRKFRLRRTRRRRFDGREFARARLKGHNSDHLSTLWILGIGPRRRL
jgi:hypothetical protein